MPLAEFKGPPLGKEGRKRGQGSGNPNMLTPSPEIIFCLRHCITLMITAFPWRKRGNPCLLPDIAEWLQVFQQVLWLHQNSCWYVGVPALFSPRDHKTVLSSYTSSCASCLPAVIHEANYSKHPARRAAWSTAFDDNVFVYDNDDDTWANNKFCWIMLRLTSNCKFSVIIVSSFFCQFF